MVADPDVRPNWYEGPLPEKSFRSIFRWGNPGQFKHPNRGLVALMQEMLGVSPEQLSEPVSFGLDQVAVDPPIRLTAAQIERFEGIVGPGNVQADGYARLRASYGQGMIDALRLREGVVESLPDVVLHPRDKRDVADILAYCHQEGIPVYVLSLIHI